MQPCALLTCACFCKAKSPVLCAVVSKACANCGLCSFDTHRAPLSTDSGNNLCHRTFAVSTDPCVQSLGEGWQCWICGIGWAQCSQAEGQVWGVQSIRLAAVCWWKSYQEKKSLWNKFGFLNGFLEQELVQGRGKPDWRSLAGLTHRCSLRSGRDRAQAHAGRFLCIAPLV